MRYEDWDVLLFPAGDGASHVPIQEFRTSCCAVKDHRPEGNTATRPESATPLITCFIPSLHEGDPFQISVHSWSSRDFHYDNKPDLPEPGAEQLWQVRVFVDKVCVCVETFPDNVSWPKVIHTANIAPPIASSPEGPHELPLLRFPRFHASVLSQTGWNATDMTGRIKVEIAEGFTASKMRDNKTNFVKLLNHCYFNFQPAPRDILRRAGIAWPNQLMFQEAKYPVSTDHLARSFVPAHGSLQRNVSTGSVHSSSIWSSPLGLPGPPPPTPAMTGYELPIVDYSKSSRSTSTYTNIPCDALPLRRANMLSNRKSPAYPDSVADRADYEVRTRLSSDQMEQLIHAIRSPPFNTGPASSMLPPPLPLHVLTPGGNGQGGATSSLGVAAGFRPGLGAQQDAIDRRGANVSDISMHADCRSFPLCTSEDDDGHVVHKTSPASIVRGRKEGSKDLNQRDFFSKVLNPEISSNATSSPASSTPTSNPACSLFSSIPADGTTRKRTRSTMKSLSGNQGSPGKLDVDMDRVQEAEKPARKVSRASVVSGMAKENENPGEDIVMAF